MKRVRISGQGMYRKMICIMLIGMGLTLTGCANSFDHMPDLTEEESALIAEYAAGILLKYDRNLKELATDSEIEAYDEREAIFRENTEALLAAKGMNGEEDEEEEQREADSPKEAEAAQPAAASFAGIAQFCGLDGFQIDYTGYKVCDSYPDAGGEDMVFAMDATQGNKLLVLEFTAQNTGAEDRELDMIGQNIQFRISVNEADGRNALPTLLLNDLSSYKDTVPAGSSVTLVLVREIPEAEAGSVGTLSLSLRSESDSASVVLE